VRSPPNLCAGLHGLGVRNMRQEIT